MSSHDLLDMGLALGTFLDMIETVYMGNDNEKQTRLEVKHGLGCPLTNRTVGRITRW